MCEEKQSNNQILVYLQLCDFYFDPTGSYPPPSIYTCETSQPPDGVRLSGQDQAGWPQGKSTGKTFLH